MWLIPFGLLAYHTPFFWEGRKPRKTQILILKERIGEGLHRGRTPVKRRTEVAENRKRTKDPHRHKGLESPKTFLPFPFPFPLYLFPSFHLFFCFVRPLHGLKMGYVTDGFLHYATPWGHYSLFGCLASPSGDAYIYPILLLSFSKRTHLYLCVSPCIDSVRFTLVLVSSSCKVKALQYLHSFCFLHWQWWYTCLLHF